MKTPLLALVVFLGSFSFPASSQSQPQVPPSAIVVKARKLLDVRKGAYIENAAVWIEGERVKEVGRAAEVLSHAPKDVKVIDLGDATVLPGLIDCHTHIMARMADTDDGYTLTLATKSQAFRPRRRIRREDYPGCRFHDDS